MELAGQNGSAAIGGYRQSDNTTDTASRTDAWLRGCVAHSEPRAAGGDAVM